jgi:hypothetical protein
MHTISVYINQTLTSNNPNYLSGHRIIGSLWTDKAFIKIADLQCLRPMGHSTKIIQWEVDYLTKLYVTSFNLVSFLEYQTKFGGTYKTEKIRNELTFNFI